LTNSHVIVIVVNYIHM